MRVTVGCGVVVHRAVSPHIVRAVPFRGDGRAVDACPQAEAKVWVDEVGSFCPYHGADALLDAEWTACIRDFVGYALGAQHEACTCLQREERRVLAQVVQVIHLASQGVFVLEDEVGDGVTQLCGEDADACSCQHVAHPVTVVHYAEGSDTCGNGIAADAVPEATRQTVLLVQNGGSHEGCCGMAGGEGVGGGTVGAHLFGGVFDAIDDACHDNAGEGIAYQHTSPLRATLIAGCLQTVGECQRCPLDVVVGPVVEACVDVAVYLAYIPFDGVGGDAENDVGHTGKREVTLHSPVALLLAYVCGLRSNGRIACDVRVLAHDAGRHGLLLDVEIGTFLTDAVQCGRQCPMQLKFTFSFGEGRVEACEALKRSNQKDERE